MVAGGNILNISGLFSNNEVFEVPDFQRNYSWEIQQVEELYDDILSTLTQQDSHFMGSLILLKGANPYSDHVDVVDGQQRLTTLFILISVIRDVAAGLSTQQVPGGAGGAPINPTFDAQGLLLIPGEQQTYRFIAHPMISDMVEKRIFAFPDPNRPVLPKKDYKYSLALRKAHKKLVERVELSLEILIDDEAKIRFLSKLLDTIKYRLKVLSVSSNTNSEAYEIFMTLNSRGMPLGPSDLVKSEIFKHLTEGLTGKQLAQTATSLTNEWQSIVQALDEGDVDQFLRHFMVSMYEGGLTGKKVFERVSKVINNPKSDPKKEARAFLDELQASAQLYSYLLNPGLISTHLPTLKASFNSLELMREILDSYRIFCLPIIDPRIKLSDAERLELIRLCEVVVIRWVLTGGNAQKLEDLMQELSLALREKPDFTKLCDTLKFKMPDDDKVSREFDDIVESSSIVRIVMHRLNYVIYDKSQLIPYNSKNIHVEHIAPNQSTAHWLQVLFPDDTALDREVEYEAASELWGNKTILDYKINQGIKQKPYIEKAQGGPTWKGYVNSQLCITQDLAHNFKHWDRDIITHRGKWIAESFVKIWAIQPDLNSVEEFSNWYKARIAP